MPRLIIKAETSSQEFDLKPGTTSVGRAPENDFQIPDPSVSSRHCQIVFSDGTIRLIDLGSTNGTLVQGVPVRETVLQSGQTIQFGSVSAVFYDESVTSAIPVAHAVAAPGPLRVQAVPAESSEEGTVMIPRAVPAVPPGTPAPSAGRKGRKPGNLARGNFFALFPDAFAYPVMGGSIIFLICGTIFYVIMEFLSSVSFYLRVIFGGYTAAFAFHLCQSTANDPTEAPSWPGVSEFFGDIVMPFIQVTILSLLCAAPALLLLIFGARSESPALVILAIPAGILSAIYFPMGMLALGMFESVVSANPLVVLPAMVKVPLEYLLICIVFGAIIAVQSLSVTLLQRMIPIPFVPSMVVGLFSLYFLMVEMRLLGLLFYAKKDRFGWL